jgi:hypothetical protein
MPRLNYTLEQAENGLLVAHCELPNGETWRHFIGGKAFDPDDAEDCAHIADMLKRDADKRTLEDVTVEPPNEADRRGIANAQSSLRELYE